VHVIDPPAIVYQLSAYEQGYRAGMTDETPVCPYKRGTAEWREWHRGLRDYLYESGRRTR
jgi:hypothetical protein